MGGNNLWMVLAVLAACFVLLAGCAQQGAAPPYSAPGGTPPYPAGGGGVPSSMAGSGRMVYTATDKAAEMGTVTSVKVTVDAAQMHSTANGWVSLNISPTTIDLLKLRAQSYSALLADANLTPGDYDQVWLDVSSVTVTDANGTHSAKLPSGTLRFDLNSQVTANQTSAVSFDFDASHSLHVTGNGMYILAPVVHVRSKDDAEVDASDRADVHVLGGRDRDDKDVGMDANGNVGVGLRIPDDANLSIDVDSIIRINAPGMEERGEAGANGGENSNASTRERNESSNGSINSSADIGARMRIGVG